MAKINWDTAPRDYFLGVNRGVLYLQNFDGSYAPGVAWNGIRSVVETPTGGEISKIYADNMRYGSVRAIEGLTGRIEVYEYPDEFAMCNGFREPSFGMRINLQKRRSFGLCYRTMVNQKDYIIHLIYGMNLNPGEHTYKTVDSSGDVVVHGWEFFTLASQYHGLKPAVSISIDTRKTDIEKIHYIEDILYGTDDTDPRLPGFEEMIDECLAYEIRPSLVHAVDTLGIWVWDTFCFTDDSVPRAVHRESNTRVWHDTDPRVNQKRPGAVYSIYDKNDADITFHVTSDAIPSTHASMIEVIEDIPNTTLMRTRKSTDGYYFNDYSIIYEEET